MGRNYHTDNKTFMMYKDWEDLVLALDNDEQCGMLMKSLFAFAKRGEEAEFTGALKMLFLTMKASIERDGKKWEETCKVRAESGKKGGIAKSQNVANGSKCKQKVAKVADKDKDKDTDTDTEKEIDISPPKSPQGDGAAKRKRSLSACSEAFDAFWRAYPKKLSKAQAMKAWEKLNPDDNLVREILSALEKHKLSAQWQKDNGQFIPYPATWLNGRRWEDNISEVNLPNEPVYEYGVEGVDYL